LKIARRRFYLELGLDTGNFSKIKRGIPPLLEKLNNPIKKTFSGH